MYWERNNSRFSLPVKSRQKLLPTPVITLTGGLKIRILKFEQSDDNAILTIYIQELERDNIFITPGINKVYLSVGANKTYRLSGNVKSNNNETLLKLNTSYFVLHRAEIALPFLKFTIEKYVNYHDNKILMLLLRKES